MMNRPTRLRRPPSKLVSGEFVVAAESRRAAKVKTVAEDASAVQLGNVATKRRAAKGNLSDGEKNALARTALSSVLRDRTNLSGEPFKVDILVKKGADEGVAEKPGESTRATAERAAIEEGERKFPDGVESSIKTTAGRSAGAKQRSRTRNKENEPRPPTAKATTARNRKTDDTKAIPANKKAKKPSATITIDAPDDSLVIESENVSDSNDAVQPTPIPGSISDKTKKIGKRVASAKSSLTNRSDRIVDSRDGKSRRRSAKSVENKKDVAKIVDKTAGKKFFKTKAVGEPRGDAIILPRKRIATSKRRPIDVKTKPQPSTSFRMRQTTLGESFAKQAATKSLRPRAAMKNYHDETSSTEKTSTNERALKKGPVYRCARFSDKSDSEASEIYEFHFNKNDSRERIVKKRKRRVGKGVVAKKTRARVPKKPMTKPQPVGDAAKVREGVATASNVATDIPEISTNRPTESKPMETGNTEFSKPKTGPETNKSSTPKPTIVKSVNLTGADRIGLNSTPEMPKTTDKIAPSRTTNASNGRPCVQYRSMLSHALLNKSLSPITKIVENFDPGSPWRAPPIPTLRFSQIKNVIQSTPQVRKFTTLSERKNVAGDGKTETTAARMNAILEKKEEVPKVERSNVKPAPRKILAAAKSPRKFGTEISNVNSSNSGSSPTVVQPIVDKPEVNSESPRKIADVAAATRLPDLSAIDVSDANYEPENFDDYDDKENSTPLFVSPKKFVKSPKKSFVKQNTSRGFERLKITTKESRDCQPGPSGLQNRSPSKFTRILKQSNLNGFLNIDRLPTTTSIATDHGIFSDPCFPPIDGKSGKTRIVEPNVGNAFGFDDNSDDSSVDGSIAKPAKVANGNKIATTKNANGGNNGAIAPTRLSVGEIRRHLRTVDTRNEKVDEKNNPKINDDEPKGKNERIVGADFADTFDELNGAGATNDEKNWQEVPLFADLEPVHFKQPPRHSYKRKRYAALNFSDHEENDDDEEGERNTGRDNHRTKKRKISKVEKERMKMVEEWAKDLNNTFEEIDHFDLVVE